MERVLNVVQFAHVYLQKTSQDIAAGTTVIATTIEQLEALRSEAQLQKIKDTIATFVKLSYPDEELSIAAQVHKRVVKRPGSLDDYVTAQPTVTREKTAEELLSGVVEKMVEELKRRFNTETFGLHSAVLALQPSSESFMDPEMLRPLVEKYGEAFGFEELEAESSVTG